MWFEKKYTLVDDPELVTIEITFRNGSIVTVYDCNDVDIDEIMDAMTCKSTKDITCVGNCKFFGADVLCFIHRPKQNIELVK